ncbi:MAG: hypothetical protein ACLU9S_04820 [Oscillospiraceae bacterium]
MSAIFGIALISALPPVLLEGDGIAAFAYLSPVIGFFCGGLGMLYAGTQRTKKAKRFRRYLALITAGGRISIHHPGPGNAHFRSTRPVTICRRCWIPASLSTGYLDMSGGRLILNDEGLRGGGAAPSRRRLPGGEGYTLDINDDDAVLGEIRRVQATPLRMREMSRKILTASARSPEKIFAYQKQNPGKAGRLPELWGNYLPTTLKDPQRLCADGGPGD